MLSPIIESIKEHRWRTLPPDKTTTDATFYEVCECGAKRILQPRYEGTARMEPTAIWISGPYECPLGSENEC